MEPNEATDGLCLRDWGEVMIDFNDYLEIAMGRHEHDFIEEPFASYGVGDWFFVYGWYEGFKARPFYVGKGRGRRAREIHYREATLLAPCEEYRRGLGDRFRLRYIADRLDEPEARAVERYIIRAINPVTNVQSNPLPPPPPPPPRRRPPSSLG